MNSSDTSNNGMDKVTALRSAVLGTRRFVQDRLQRPDPNFFSQLSEADVRQLERNAVVAKRFNLSLVLSSVAPVLVLALCRGLSGAPLATDPLASGPDVTLAACLFCIPLVLLVQMLFPLDGGPEVLRSLAKARRQPGERTSYFSPSAHAYRETVRARRELRVVDIECMRELQEASMQVSTAAESL